MSGAEGRGILVKKHMCLHGFATHVPFLKLLGAAVTHQHCRHCMHVLLLLLQRQFLLFL